MNKRYMDFVPAKGKRTVAPKPVKKPVIKPKKVTNGADNYKLGMIEDLRTDEKSPILTQQTDAAKEEVKELKSRKVGIKEETKVEKTSGLKTTKPEETFVPPRTKFINQDKVVKRPLSKNVYQKKAVVPKEEPKGPVTIITKPEKQARISLVVIIILTIILGAAAGTVAFLLLPK